MKAQAVVAAALLFCGVLYAQANAERTSDEKLLETGPYAAKMQADSFIRALVCQLYNRSISGERTSRQYELMHKLVECRQHQADESKTLEDLGAKEVADGQRQQSALDNADLLGPASFNPKAGDLADKIEADKKRQDRWESSAWTVSHSALQPGESINLEMGNGVVAVNGTFQTAIARGLPISPSTATPNQKTVYFVTAPPEIRSRILMEGLRSDLNNFAAILQFDGKSAESDSFWVSWKSAWFDAQEVFCRYNPGAKFTNLNEEEQTCKASPAVQSKTHN